MDLLSLILLALAASVYPPLLAGVILILGRPQPLRMLVAFLGGGMAISVPLGVVIVASLHGSGAATTNSPAHPVTDIVVGSLSLLLAWAIGTRRVTGALLNRRRRRRSPPDQTTPSFVERSLSGGSPVMGLVAGVVLNLPGMWYLAALAGIAQSQASALVALLAILLFNVIMFALIEIPIVGYLVEPERVTTFVTRLRAAMQQHSRTIAVLIAGAVGLWLLVRGIVNLVG